MFGSRLSAIFAAGFQDSSHFLTGGLDEAFKRIKGE